jgi:hypothetical protein
MRPIGDDTPQEELFEKWCIDLWPKLKPLDWSVINYTRSDIEMVFSSHKPTIDMFRKRGIFVLDCNQGQ